MPLDCLGILNLAQRMLKEGKTVRWREHRHFPFGGRRSESSSSWLGVKRRKDRC